MRSVTCLAVSILAVSGCSISAGSPSSTGDGGARADGATRTADGGAGADAAGIPAGKMEGFDTRQCFDALDNDSNGTTDCADESCRASVPACCIGAATTTCCSMPVTTSAPSFTTCTAITGPAFETCIDSTGLAGAPFGSPSPRVEAGALLPGGDASFDSGWVLDRVVAPIAERIELTARIRTPVPPDCGLTCTQSAAFGLAAAAPSGDTYVSPLIGVLVSGSLQQASVVVGGEVVQSWRLPDGSSRAYTLTVAPDGRATITIEGVASLELVWVPATSARIVLYGRNVNPAPTDPAGAGFEAFDVTSSLCDIPTAWMERRQVLPRTGVSWDAGRSLRAPSVAVDASGTALMAFESAGAIYLAHPTLGTPVMFDLAMGTSLSNAALRSTEGVHDPELVWDPARAEWLLFHTLVLPSGERTIGRSTAPADPTTFTAAEPVVDLALLRDVEAIASLEAPSVVIDAGQWLMVARAVTTDGKTELVLLGSTDGQRFDLRSVIRAVREDAPFAAFDRDDVASPSLSLANGAYQVYFSGRRGTRWSIGLVASMDLESWFEPTDGAAVIDASGSGFDAVGTSDPDVVVRGEDVDLYYTGAGSDRSVIGLATRRASMR